jgi:hypothetical protein
MRRRLHFELRQGRGLGRYMASILGRFSLAISVMIDQRERPRALCRRASIIALLLVAPLLSG